MKTVEQLVAEITHANILYREGEQIMFDHEYDALVAELHVLDPNNDIFKKGIIEPAPTTRKRKLQTQMMSLDKCKTVYELKQKLVSLGLSKNELIVITPKYNGISLENNTYQCTASTRGDGVTGQNCDAHFLKMNQSTLLNDPICIGEAIISRKNWNENFKGKIAPSGKPYKLNNATVAGLLNNDTPSEELKFVDYIRYGMVGNIEADINKDLQLRTINQECEIKVSFEVIVLEDLTEDLMDELYQEWNKVYPCDGVVIDINRYTLREKLGRLSNGNPAYAYALKLDKWVEEFPTTITGHDFTISKQGKLRGVVTFDPIIIEGTEVKQASFYNARFLIDFCLYKGVSITVKKSGEIIPKIMSVEGVVIPRKADFKSTQEYNRAYDDAKEMIQLSLLPDSITIDQLDALTYCPSCGKTMFGDENAVDLECHNPNCESMIVSKLEHFFLAIGVEEFGRPSIQTMYNNGYRTPEAIMNITPNLFAAIEGFGLSTAKTTLDQFKKIRKNGLPLARIMYAHDVFEGKIGESTAQLIFDNTGDDVTFTKADLLKIKGVSDLTADCFLKGLEAFYGIKSLIQMSYISSPKKVVTGDKYIGLNVCFSGIRDKALEEVITSNGGQIASGVSKTTTHLIVADVSQSTSKTVKARELGCAVMTIEQFKAL